MRGYYHLTTFGCQMNEHDSERIRGVLEEAGWLRTEAPGDADLLVYNTCSVRQSAESRLLGRLGEASRLKKERPGMLVAIGGCFAQNRKEAIFSDLPFLDAAFGPQNIGDLPALLLKAANGPAATGAFEDNPSSSAELPSRRALSHHAWVQVMTGCTNFCAYCVVPQVRGPERSRPASDILAEVERLVDGGVVEVTLLGQNVNAYGLDGSVAKDGEPGSGGGSDFATLLALLDAVEGLQRIRFTTSHPRDLSDSLIGAVRELPKVCEHVHLPAQSGSTRILERMNRGYTKDQYVSLVGRLYEAVPGLTLTTDLIVGFPGEKEEDFFRTMKLVEECRFDGAFTFRYSSRPGTAAAEMPGSIPEGTIKRRMKELVGLTQEIASLKNEALVGDMVEVMVEGKSRQGGGQYRGRTRGNKIVNFSVATGGVPAPGILVPVRIESSTSTTLRGIAAGR